MQRLTAMVLWVLALAACSNSGTENAQSAQKTPPPPQKTVIDDQLKALEKAKAVQGTVDQQKADTDKAIEDAGG